MENEISVYENCGFWERNQLQSAPDENGRRVQSSMTHHEKKINRRDIESTTRHCYELKRDMITVLCLFGSRIESNLSQSALVEVQGETLNFLNCFESFYVENRTELTKVIQCRASPLRETKALNRLSFPTFALCLVVREKLQSNATLIVTLSQHSTPNDEPYEKR
ncbi:CLUMA_CG004266, isoform A [Clunio marinus]|uniref:CLUMA_CG004266, isoform A n=1 Tax=Clunio marinus TaxID=568069 RepID=A0A1J1HRG1_9DIPT|nr:CLUMA_CG004266, isoform A [Clunio marinus]